jgi:peptidoglycan/LPS O-acetylase OafA/YrhL
VLSGWLLFEFAKPWMGQPAFQGETSWPSFWQNLTLTQAFGPNSISWNYPSWSICLELWANLVAGVILVMLGRWWRLGVVAIIALLIGFYASQYVIDYGAAQGRFDILANDADYVAGFFLGMLTHGLYRGLRRIGVVLPWGVDVLALAGVLAVFRFADVMPFLAKAAAFAVVVLVLAFERGPASGLLRRPAALWLGTISYSIYLTHVVFVNIVTNGLYELGAAWGQTMTRPIYGDDVIIMGGPWVADAAALVTVLATLAASALTYRFVEDPARRWFNSISRGLGR